tara:strand:- start:347 stop:601 length:255 start_codon:yes stop_codon:yes gene_type:complete
MINLFYILLAYILGTIVTCSGVLLGAYLVRRTYLELTATEYPNTIDKEQTDTNPDTILRDSYDWSTYDKSIQGIEDGLEETPES